MYSRIASLPPSADMAEMESAELRGLAALWREKKTGMDAGINRRFVEALKREWAIETGIIERLYTLERGVTEQLIEQGIKEISQSSNFYIDIKSAPHNEAKAYYFNLDLIEIARRHGYYANFDGYKTWTQLSIHTHTVFEIVLSVHGYGNDDSGIMMVSGFTFEKIKSGDDEGPTEKTAVQSINNELFQFNYLEDFESVRARFEGWFQESMDGALARWYKTI